MHLFISFHHISHFLPPLFTSFFVRYVTWLSQTLEPHEVASFASFRSSSPLSVSVDGGVATFAPQRHRLGPTVVELWPLSVAKSKVLLTSGQIPLLCQPHRHSGASCLFARTMHDIHKPQRIRSISTLEARGSHVILMTHIYTNILLLIWKAIIATLDIRPFLSFSPFPARLSWSCLSLASYFAVGAGKGYRCERKDDG